MALLSLQLHEQFPQYEPIGPDLLTNIWGQQTPENSRIEVTEDGLILYSDAERGSVSAYQGVLLPQHGTLLQLSAEARSTDVKLGKKSWQRARLILIQNNGQKDDWVLPHTVVALFGSHDWKKYHGVFVVAPQTQKIKVMAQLNQVSGLFQLKNIRLYPVSESPIFSVIRNVILGAWGVFFLFLIRSCLVGREASIIARALLVFLMISIVAGTLMPGEIKQEILDDVVAHIAASGGQFMLNLTWDLSKLWHFGFFLLLGTMLGVMMTGISLVPIMAVVLMLAAGTELAQLYIDGRTPLLTDFFLDIFGSILGVILIRVFKF